VRLRAKGNFSLWTTECTGYGDRPTVMIGSLGKVPTVGTEKLDGTMVWVSDIIYAIDTTSSITSSFMKVKFARRFNPSARLRWPS
jgi:hypothetical protein